MKREQWSVAEVADHLGVSPVTVRSYASRGQMPAPDGRVGRSPWWHPDTIKGWHRPRRKTDADLVAEAYDRWLGKD